MIRITRLGIYKRLLLIFGSAFAFCAIISVIAAGHNGEAGLFIGASSIVTFFLVAVMIRKPLAQIAVSTGSITHGASEVGNAIGIILGVSHELSNASTRTPKKHPRPLVSGPCADKKSCPR